ncbi:uncharacterized protein LOC124891639 [Capsicum annuum]|uniref:uncharacterized protein LOC124891639 n=1 Tax=Capsicum annuum TaxID=4072 RepID=UPI001FB070E4|nr:uncharacterized protein LOC124891639 [Capsicum annuum]
MEKDFPEHYVTWVMHGELNVLPNSRNIEVIQDAPPFVNLIDLLINEVFGGLRHEGVNTGPSQVAGEEETLHDLSDSNNKDYFELLKEGSEDLYEGSKYSKLKFLLKLYHIKCLFGLSDKGMTMVLDLLRDAFKFVKIPISFYEAKKIINKLCLDYIKIDACPNDCMLYWEDDINAESCKHCHTSRWKPEKDNDLNHVPSTKYMRWHAEDDNKDGNLRHPRDGLAIDGFNPFGATSTNYSIYSVILFPYNLPPWLCMKQSNFILMIIPGPCIVGNNIDVYLQSLIKELNELWSEDVDTFDSSKNEMFKIQATLVWTISDFPRLDSLSGWNMHTGLACPSCNFNAEPCQLRHSRKWCFIGHRQFLSRNYKFRLMRHRFDRNMEERTPPKKLSGSKILQQVKDINVTFGRQSELQKRKRKKNVGENATQQWNKRIIFFHLPYWEFNPFPHNLDPMYIEKNIFDNVIFTLLNDKEKSKDHVKARKDLQDMGIRHDLWVDENDECKFDAFQLLPLAIRNVLPRQVVAALVEFSSLFRQLCLKSLSPVDLDKLQNRIVKTLCHLEILFPPSLFTVMIHLTIYLVDEVKKVAWYIIVGFILSKGNKSQSEGSIAESYIVEEALTFYARYFEEIETRLNRSKRVNDEPSQNEAYEKSSMFPQQGKHVGGFITEPLTHLEETQAHRYVLLNCAVVKPFIE